MDLLNFKMPSCAACNCINWFAKQENKSTKPSRHFARVISNLQLKVEFESLLLYIRPQQILENTCGIPWSLTPPSISSFFWRMVEFCRSHRQELLLCAQSQWVVSKNFEKTSGKLPQGQGLTSTVRTEGLCYSAGKNLFPGLVDHSFDTTAEDNHQHFFVKMAAGIYWTIRMNHLDITYSLGGGQVTARLDSPTDRSLPMPSTVATESGLVCVCLQGCDVHSKHM